MSILFSAVARRASPIVSKFGPCPLPFSPSSLIGFNPWLASTTPRSLSSLEGVRVSANERMKRMLEAAIRRREELGRDLVREAVKFLKAKGIDGSLWESLKMYMINRNDTEHLDWLKKIISSFTM